MRPKLVVSIIGALLFASAMLAAACGSGAARPAPQPSGGAPEQTPVPVQTACSKSDPTCKSPAAPTPLPLDPTVLSILSRDSVVRELVGAGEPWKDYWLDMLGTSNGPHGDQLNRVVMLFARPISFSGVVPSMSDPCSGHGGEDDRVAPDDPCIQEPRVYGTSYVEFHGIRAVHVAVDVGRAAVVEVFGDDSGDQIVDWEIANLTANRPATPTPSP